MAIPPIKVIITGVDHFTKELGQSMQKLQKMGQSMSKIGKTMTLTMSAPIALFGYQTLQTAANFESSMNRVQNLTQASGADLEMLTKRARELGATTKFSAAEAADAMGLLGMAGFSTTQIMESLSGILNLSAAANMDLSEATDIATSVLAGFNLQAKDMAQTADIMTLAAQATNTDIRQLGEGMKYVGPVASAMKLSLEETTAALGLLSNAGIQGSMAGTTLRGALGRIAAPAEEVKKILARLKIPKENIINAKGDIISLNALITEFGKSGATASDLLEIFGDRAGPGMAALISMGAPALDKMTKKLYDAGGVAKEAADVQLRGLTGQMKQLKAAFQELQLSIADSGLLKWVTDLALKLTLFVRQVAKASPGFLRFAVVLAGVVAVIGPLIWMIGSLLTALASIKIAIASAGGIIALITNPIGWIIAAIIGLIAVLKLLGVKWSTIFSMLLFPLLPLIAITKVIMKHWSSLIPFFKAFGIIFGKVLEETKKSLMPWIKLFEKIVSLITKAIEGVMKFGGKMFIKMLPEDIKRKAGFLPSAAGEAAPTPVPAGELAQRAATTMGGAQPNVTNIKIEDKVGVKLTSDVEQGDINTEVHRGLAFGGAY